MTLRRLLSQSAREKIAIRLSLVENGNHSKRHPTSCSSRGFVSVTAKQPATRQAHRSSSLTMWHRPSQSDAHGSKSAKSPLGRRQWRLLANHIGGFLRNHDDRRIDVASDQVGKNRR